MRKSFWPKDDERIVRELSFELVYRWIISAATLMVPISAFLPLVYWRKV